MQIFAASTTRATVVQTVEINNQMKRNIAVYSRMYTTRVWVFSSSTFPRCDVFVRSDKIHGRNDARVTRQ